MDSTFITGNITTQIHTDLIQILSVYMYNISDSITCTIPIYVGNRQVNALFLKQFIWIIYYSSPPLGSNNSVLIRGVLWQQGALHAFSVSAAKNLYPFYRGVLSRECPFKRGTNVNNSVIISFMFVNGFHTYIHWWNREMIETPLWSLYCGSA